MREGSGLESGTGLGEGSGLLYHTALVIVSFQDKLVCGEFVFYKAAVGFVNQAAWCWSILSAGIL